MRTNSIYNGIGFRRLSLIFLLAVASPSGATLLDRGGGLIYDTVLDVTWVQDANLCLTLGNCVSGRTDGRMTWVNANLWAANLDFGGFDDWRLPIMETPTGTCIPSCPLREYEHMYFENLNATAALEDKTGNQTGDGGVTFSNIQRFGYWSSTDAAFLPDLAKAFFFEFGSEFTDPKDFVYSAWAVRDGDVSAPPGEIPAPGSLLLAGLGALGLGWARRSSRRRLSGMSRK